MLNSYRPRPGPRQVRSYNRPVLEDRVILKQNDLFMVSDLAGDVPSAAEGGLGLYRSDTRFLSRYELRLNGRRPILLNQGVDRAYVATFQLTNPELVSHVGHIPRQSLSVRRTRFVHDGVHERIGIQNCNPFPVEFELELRLEADFLDIFQVRGFRPPHDLGRPEPPTTTQAGLRFGYRGADGLHRTTNVIFHPVPTLVEGGTASMPVHLAAYGHRDPRGSSDTLILLVSVLPRLRDEEAQEAGFLFDDALGALERTYQRWNSSCTRFTTDNELLDGGLVWRNLEDLRVLCDERPTGLFPTAGLPWYAVPFGRDALITSIQTLALNPELAVGTLRFLAQHQGQREDPYRAEEPGKILHEMRFGELARLGLIPHTPFYGSIDATPLFLVALVELVRWTGDTELLAELRPHVHRALEWIDRYGDRDQDGFVEYGAATGAPQPPLLDGRRRHRSLRQAVVVNQGWKDSADSLVEAVGERWAAAPLPAALVEVQGYVYHGKAGLAAILRRLGQLDQAERLEQEAERLRARFEEAYWMPGERFYAQALDRDKKQVPSISSNPGHCLWSGIAAPQRAAAVAERLTSDEMFSGWGVRTLSARALNYNPMSYHNGSVWPHDNSIIAAGMRRYGHRERAALVASSVLEACLRFNDRRIPELFCGFSRDRRFQAGPGEYLVSCSPQAWGAGALFHFLQVLLGIEVDALEGRLRIDPVETPLFRRLRVEGMRVGGELVSFTVECGEGARVVLDRRPAGFRHLELPP